MDGVGCKSYLLEAILLAKELLVPLQPPLASIQGLQWRMSTLTHIHITEFAANLSIFLHPQPAHTASVPFCLSRHELMFPQRCASCVTYLLSEGQHGQRAPLQHSLQCYRQLGIVPSGHPRLRVAL